MVTIVDQDSPPLSPIWTPTGLEPTNDYFMSDSWLHDDRSVLDLTRRNSDSKSHLATVTPAKLAKSQYVTFATVTETPCSTDSNYSSSSYEPSSPAEKRFSSYPRPVSVHTNPKTPTMEEIAPALPESPDVATAAYHTPVLGGSRHKNSLQRKLAPNLTESLELLVDVHHRRDADRLLAGTGCDKHSPLRSDVLAALKRDSVNRSQTSLVPSLNPASTPLPPEPTVRGLGLYSAPNRGTESVNAVYAIASRPERVARSASTPAVQSSLARHATAERGSSLLSISSATSIRRGSLTTTGTAESVPALPSLPEAAPVEHIASYAEIKAMRAAAAAADAQAFDSSAPPAEKQMDYAAKLELFDAAGNRVRFGDLLSQRTLVLFVRHWYSSSCAEYVRSVAHSVTDDVLSTTETQVIIVGHGSPSMIPGYRKHLACPFPIYTDPTRKLQDALGILPAPLSGRDSPSRQRFLLRLNRAFDMFVAAAKMTSFRGGDRRQLGGEFIMMESSCSFAHRMRLPADHTPVPALLKAITKKEDRQSYRVSIHGKSVNSVLIGPNRSTAEFGLSATPTRDEADRRDSCRRDSVRGVAL